MEPKKTSTPIDTKIVDQLIKESGIQDVGAATIREVVALVNKIEAKTGEKYIRMEMGVPGLMPPEIGTNAEIEALKMGVASKYPMIDGIPQLKSEISLFVKNFLNIDVNKQGCIPTVGSMQGGFAVFLIAKNISPTNNKTLFIDPGFPFKKQQVKVLDLEYDTFDVYNYRGEKLREKLDSYLKTGEFTTILYSNPNNPSWICFTETELKIIGEMANKYNVTIIEDLAYFAMDFRKDYSKPGEAPYQPSVAKYTDNWIMLISSSKSFSYAGQRIGMLVISDTLYNKQFDSLLKKYGNGSFGYTMIYKILYSLSSGTSHSPQYGLYAMLKAVNSGDFNFVNEIKIYGERAKVMKKLFTNNGFSLVYDKDENDPLADGFYFTVSYPGFSGAELLKEFIYYGISAIALGITGSERTEGIRACVSQTNSKQFSDLENRLKVFNANNK